MCDMKELFRKLAEVKAASATESRLDTIRLKEVVAATRASNKKKEVERTWKD